MSIDVARGGITIDEHGLPAGDGHGHKLGYQTVAHQFENIDQQNESYVVGMWTFLVTEIMFFGAVFAAYFLMRSLYLPAFVDAQTHLNVAAGTVNTFILLLSSLTMALAVHAAQVQKRFSVLGWLSITLFCAVVFLGVKAFEYTDKIQHHLVPGKSFRYERNAHAGANHGKNNADHATGADAVAASGAGQPAAASAQQNDSGVGADTGTQRGQQAARESERAINSGDPATRGMQSEQDLSNKAQLFFSFYFIMTGIHALHIIIGIGVLSAIAFLTFKQHPAVADYMPIEMAGLYWHFVDIVWIFLFPFLYLLAK